MPSWVQRGIQRTPTAAVVARITPASSARSAARVKAQNSALHVSVFAPALLDSLACFDLNQLFSCLGQQLPTGL